MAEDDDFENFLNSPLPSNSVDWSPEVADCPLPQLAAPVTIGDASKIAPLLYDRAVFSGGETHLINNFFRALEAIDACNETECTIDGHTMQSRDTIRSQIHDDFFAGRFYIKERRRGVCATHAPSSRERFFKTTSTYRNEGLFRCFRQEYVTDVYRNEETGAERTNTYRGSRWRRTEIKRCNAGRPEVLPGAAPPAPKLIRVPFKQIGYVFDWPDASAIEGVCGVGSEARVKSEVRRAVASAAQGWSQICQSGEGCNRKFVEVDPALEATPQISDGLRFEQQDLSGRTIWISELAAKAPPFIIDGESLKGAVIVTHRVNVSAERLKGRAFASARFPEALGLSSYGRIGPNDEFRFGRDPGLTNIDVALKLFCRTDDSDENFTPRVINQLDPGDWPIWREADIVKRKPEIRWSATGVLRHEFGHALGFAHDHIGTRYDCDEGRDAMFAGAAGGVNAYRLITGEPDRSSIMSMPCARIELEGQKNAVALGADLSATDIASYRCFYSASNPLSECMPPGRRRAQN